MPKKIIKNYILFVILLSLAQSFFFAIYQVFLASRGMNFLQMNLINSFYMLSIFFFEIPTGAFADIFGRKKSIVVGSFILSASFLIYFLSGNFWLFVAAEVVGALGKTFLSGAVEAWVVDSLDFHKYEGKIENVFKREAQFSQVAIIVGSVAGAYVGKVDISYPWLLSAGATMFVGIFALFSLKEKYFVKKKFKVSFAPIKNVAIDSIKYGLGNKSILYVIAFGAILSISIQGLNMQWPFVFQGYGLDVSKLGWIFSGISISTFLGGWLSVRFAEMIGKEKEAIIVSQVITTIGMIVASTMIGFIPVMGGFFLHEMGRGMFKPLKQTYMSHRIVGNKRATILSFDSMISMGGAGLGLILSGYLANSHSVSLSWLVSGIILGASIPIFLKLKNGD